MTFSVLVPNTIDSREQGLATLLYCVLFYTVFTGYASGLELTPC